MQIFQPLDEVYVTVWCLCKFLNHQTHLNGISSIFKSYRAQPIRTSCRGENMWMGRMVIPSKMVGFRNTETNTTIFPLPSSRSLCSASTSPHLSASASPDLCSSAFVLPVPTTPSQSPVFHILTLPTQHSLSGEAVTVDMAAALMRRAFLLRFSRTLTPNTSSLPGTINSSGLVPISRFLSDHGTINIDLSNEESKRRLLNRLIYRSRQRGFLELDLVLGKWVEENIRSMDEPRIRALVDVLDLENPDLWKWLTGQEQPPEAVNSNPVFSAVRSKVMDNLSHADPETRAAPGQPWVRGWDDKMGTDGPRYGNQ